MGISKYEKIQNQIMQTKDTIIAVLGAVVIYKGITGLMDEQKKTMTESNVTGTVIKKYRKPRISNNKKIASIEEGPRDNSFMGLPRWIVRYTDGFVENVFSRYFPSDYNNHKHL